MTMSYISLRKQNSYIRENFLRYQPSFSTDNTRRSMNTAHTHTITQYIEQVHTHNGQTTGAVEERNRCIRQVRRVAVRKERGRRQIQFPWISRARGIPVLA